MEPTIRELNEAFYEKIASDDPALHKQAQDDLTEYTRMKMREDGFLRRVLPPTSITNQELDRTVESPLPSKVVDREPDSPVAYTIPFATLPMNQYIYGDRYRIDFARPETPRFTVDLDELRTWTMDIRQVLSANSLKDLLAEEDGRFIQAVNAILVGPNVPIPEAGGNALWQTVDGGITRDTVNDALKIMNQTPAHLEVATVLANHVFAKDLQKWGHDEVGGNLAQEVYQNGIAERTIFGVRWLFTIKRELVGDRTIFMFADPRYLGKLLILYDATMHVKKEHYLLWWFAYELIGAGIGNSLALARVDFEDIQHAWPTPTS